MHSLITDLKNILITHEGLKLKPYKDTVGKITIGVGRDLDDMGITEDEAMLMLDNDIARTVAEANKFTWFGSLSENRQIVICSMIFNLGLSRFKNFKNMIAAIEIQHFCNAAEEMRNSTWATQVGDRCNQLAAMMTTG